MVHSSLIKSLSPVDQICLPGGSALGDTARILRFWFILIALLAKPET